MRIGKALAAGVVLLALGASALEANEPRNVSTESAFDQGIGALKGGDYDKAIAALNNVVDKGPEKDRFFARFYLARIHSDASGTHTDHARAYQLFEQVIVTGGDVDPDDGHRAPFISKSLIALAGYLRSGLPQIDLRADPDRANDFLQDAASVYNDKDAQFELARMQLGPEASPEENKLGKHYVWVLANDGHPGAQAYLADLYWRGRFVKQDGIRALALVKLSIANAPSHDRLWIEDIYQNIFCGSTPSVRKQAEATASVWRSIFPRPPVSTEEVAAAARMPSTERFCKGGELVDLGPAVKSEGFGNPLSAPASSYVPSAPPAMQGNMTGFGIVGVGAKN